MIKENLVAIETTIETISKGSELRSIIVIFDESEFGIEYPKIFLLLRKIVQSLIILD